MAKKILSWALACALILTCFSGIALVSAADELPTPYVWYTVDQTTGEVTASQTANVSPLDPYVSTEIPGGNGYGLKLTGDWQGFWIGSDAMYGLPEDVSVTLLVEYYVDSAATLNEQLFRIMPASVYDANGVAQAGEQWIDYFTAGTPNKTTGVIELDKTAVMAYTYPAAQLDAIRNTGMAMGIKGCYGGTNAVYIKSMKWVETKYLNTPVGASYYAFEEAVLTDYYPNYTTTFTNNMKTHPEGDVFTHFQVYGAPAATDSTVNKPVYIKIYTKAGYENTSITLQQFEAYTPTGRWACDNGYANPVINVVNGVGGVMLPETSFTNANNGGSFRITQAMANQIARIEVYDVATACAEKGVAEEMAALFHEYKMDNNYGITVEGAVEPVGGNAGNTGLVQCAACGATFADYEEYYKEPYGWFDVSDGTVQKSHSLAAQGGVGSITPQQIPGTDEYGFRLDADWSGFYFGGTMLKNVPAGQSVTVAVEYYMDMAFLSTDNHQVFRYQINSNGFKDMFTKNDQLLSQKTGLFLHTLTAEEVAAIGEGDFRVTILGCAAGAGKTYIKSLKVVNTELVNPIDYTDKGYSVIGLEGQEISPVYYPGLTVPYAVNGSFDVLEKSDTFAGYYYVRLSGAVAGNADNTNRPMLIKLVAKEGYENANLGTFKVDVSDASGAYYWCDAPAASFKNGVATYIIDACLKDRLNGSGSLRIGMDVADKIARVEVYDAADVCRNENLSAADVASVHAAMHAANYNVTVEGAVDATDAAPGFTGNVICNACGQVIAEGEVTFKDPYVYMTTDGGVKQSNVCTGWGEEAWSTVPVSEIPGTGEYGVKLTGDWQGFFLGGNIMTNVPAGQSVTMVVEYYIDLDFAPTERIQLFRYWSPAVGAWTDVFSDTHKLLSKQNGLLFCTFTAEEVAAIGSGDVRFKVLGCNAGTNVVYIKSLKLVNTNFVHVPTAEDCAVVDFEGQLLCDYYPEIAPAYGINTTWQLLEKSDTFAGHYYIRVNGEMAGNEDNTNRKMLLKFYAREGFENATIDGGWQFSVDSSDAAGNYYWNELANVPFVDGVAEIEVDACFKNRLNGAGSLRISADQIAKIARIEIYNAAAECTHESTTTTTVEATCTENGSVTVTCDACGEVISTEIIEAKGHNEVTTTVEATCTENGSITVSCDVCGEVISTEVIEAKGHKEPTEWNAKQYCLNDCGTVIYDLQALLNAGGEVTLEHDLVTDVALTVDTTVVLNLAGYSIATTELDTEGYGVFYVPAGGDLTINGEGTINGVGGNIYCIAIWADGGKVTINGGTYTNVGAGEDDHYDLIYVKNGGEVVINGGTFIAHTPKWTLNSNDKLKGTFIVNGGKFYQYDPANNTTENPTKVWVADGFETVLEGDYYVLVEHVCSEGELTGVVEATSSTPGYSGDVVCECGEIIEKGHVTPILVIGEIDENGIYREDGKVMVYKGLIQIDGYYYYADRRGAVLKDTTYAIKTTNGYEGVDERIRASAAYYFDAEGRIVFEKNGIYDGIYYEHDQKVPYAGLVNLDGNYYYIVENGAIVTGRYFISNISDELRAAGFSNGYYLFDENGVMNTAKAVVDGYYYADGGKCTAYAGLVEVNGDYYYVLKNGEVRLGRYSIVSTNGLKAKGHYSFGTDGKMLMNTVENGYYYTESGMTESYLGLVKAADGNLYYVLAQGKVVRDNANFYVQTTNGYVTKGYYAFDANGAMVD